MAAQKSTASQKPRTSKQTKPGGKRIKPGGKIAPKRIDSVPVWVVVGPAGDETVYLSREEAEAFSATHTELTGETLAIEERLASITAGKRLRITSKERFGIMVGDRLVSTAADLGEACKQMGTGYVVALMCNDPASREAERAADRRQMRRQTNPLAAKLAEQHSYVLYAVGEELGDVADLMEPSGQTLRPMNERLKGRDMFRRATDDEAAVSELYVGKRFSIDVRRGVPGQVVRKLTAFISKLQATVERLKTAKNRGIFDPPIEDEETADHAAPKVGRRGKAVSP